MSLIEVAMLMALLAGTQQQPAPLAGTGKWTVNFAEKMCLAERNFGAEDRPVVFAMRPAPLDRNIEVRLSEVDPSYISRVDKGSVTLRPSGRHFPVTLHSFGPITNGRRVTSFYLDDVEVKDLVMADAIEVDRGHAGAPIAIAPGKAEAVIASMSQCEDSLMRGWGVDPVAMHKLSRQPHPVGDGARSWFKPKDYPKTAKANFRGGRTLALVTIGPDGRVAGCNIAESAGNPDLDSKTCVVLTERGRYEPGLDAAGKPVSAQKLVGVRWAMGGFFFLR